MIQIPSNIEKKNTKELPRNIEKPEIRYHLQEPGYEHQKIGMEENRQRLKTTKNKGGPYALGVIIQEVK